MFTALSRAFSQAADPAFRRVFFKAFFAALGTFLLLWLGCWFVMDWLGELLRAWLADAQIWDWLRTILDWLFGAVAFTSVIVASGFLFPAVMVLIMSIFLEEIAEAVENRYYPGLPPARPQPFREMLWGSLSFALLTLVANLAALPFYLVFLFLPPLIPFVFYLINGYLLGREYFELVAVRRLDLRSARRLRRAFRGRVLLAGVVIAFFLTLPFINLVMPLVATAFLLHVFERIRANGRVAAT